MYRSWCHRQGHSVSRPTVAKVADFLMFLRSTLSLSYSSIASYRSMLSGVFRFILPELSSHFVLHDLLPSFRLERSLPSSRLPPWDLQVVLRFLRGPPFELLAFFSTRSYSEGSLSGVLSYSPPCGRAPGCCSRCLLFRLRCVSLLSSRVLCED